ncbi:MAG: hypothetical protein DRQ46_00435 [Gammaproteobacteria bacterium]|nr:MAG: hypothetical protein DRQ46_00435 [Gammaproteobacteria bacterium]
MTDKIYEASVDKYNRLIDKATDKLNKSVALYVKDFDVDKLGRITKSKANQKLVMNFDRWLRSQLGSSGYDGVLVDFAKDTKPFINKVIDWQATEAGAGVIPIVLKSTDISSIVAMQKIDYSLLDNRITASISSIKEQLYRSMVLGEEWSSATGFIKTSLDKNLQQYTQTYINTSRSLLIQEMEDVSASHISGEHYWEYIGPDDKKTREICVEALNKKVFTDDERQAYIDEHGVRYNCRHIFMQITKEYYEEYSGNEIDK